MTPIYNNQIQSQNIHVSSTYLYSLGKKVMQLAVPILGIMALSGIPTAEGTAIGYAACIAACEAMALAGTAGAAGIPALPACIKGCLPIFFLPIP